MTHPLLKNLKLDVLVRPILPVGGWILRASPRLITCREFNAFIYDYIEGNLSEKQTVLFQRHMRVCPSCRNFLKTYIATYKARSQVSPYDDIEVPVGVPQDLINAVLEVRKVEIEDSQ